jgi:NADH:ubiquinone reductase (H+-translocating)
MAPSGAGLSMNPRFDSNAGPRSVAIVGAGFAGRAVARKPASAPAGLRIIDSHNDNPLSSLSIAWLRLGGVHIFVLIGLVLIGLVLIGLRNRFAVFLNWVWAWLTHPPGTRLISAEERTRAHAPQVFPVSTQLSRRS